MLERIEAIPPHDLDAEQAMLAGVLQNKTAMAAVMATGLRPDDCYHQCNEAILAAAYELTRKGQPTDLVTVKAAVEGKPSIDFDYLLDVATGPVLSSLTAHYAAIVLEKARRRAAIEVLTEGLVALYDPHSEDPVSQIQARVMGIETRQATATAVDFHEAVDVAQKPAERAFSTGFYDLDQLAWVEPGDFVILGARPSDGKTALALQIMLAVSAGLRVLFQSLEMPKKAIAIRYLSMAAEVSGYQLRTGHLRQFEREAVTNAGADAGDLKLRIDDRAGLTVAQIAASLRREMLAGPVGLLVVDHLLKVRPADPRASRHAQMTQISNDLAQLGRQTGVPILGLYQLNRASANEQRKPRASDLRESGSVEEDADHIWLLHRPDHHAMFSAAELLVEKNRNGPCGLVKLTFEAARTRFKSVERMAL